MVQNRNKLIKIFIGNIVNAVVHEILAKAIENEDIRKHYSKELKTSIDKAKSYRNKINPTNTSLPKKDADYIREKIMKKAKAELQSRIAKGYDNIDITLIESVLDNVLSKTENA